MSVRLPREPKCRLHKATGQAVVSLNGKDYYLGRHATPASRERYHRLLAEWKAGQGLLITPSPDLTIMEMAAAFWRHAEAYYRKLDGSPDEAAVRAVLDDVPPQRMSHVTREFTLRLLRENQLRLVAGES